MKTIETIQEAELVTSLNGKPFVITGPIESVTELYEAAQTDFNAHPVQRTTMGTKVAQTALEHATEPIELTGRKATITAKLYDLVNGSNMYELLKQKRQDERDLAMARSLGLMSTVYCQKHEKELAKLHRL